MTDPLLLACGTCTYEVREAVESEEGSSFFSSELRYIFAQTTTRTVLITTILYHSLVLYSNYYHRQCNECSVPETAEMVVRACICTSPPLVSQSIPESPEHTTAGITVAAVFVILFKFEIEQEYHHGIGN